ncbi:MAG: tetratricopeptide repeat-containing protein [Nitrospira sp.]|nr:tetratricopeptide repeat-containing protein [Nitrospira sp.]
MLVNGHKVTNYFYSAQYKDLKAQADAVEQQFERTRRKIEKYPDDEDFKADWLRLSMKRNDIVKTLDDLKQEVIRLAETFTKIPINTERLKLARQYFETGDYSAARTILDAEQMGNELDALLHREERLQEEQAEVEALRIEKAHEFLILARLISVDFTLADRFEKTIVCFEQSLKASQMADNTFEFAYFLHEHNQFSRALSWYTKTLAIRRRLAEAIPHVYPADLAATLNNLAVLESDQNNFPAARAAYDEALGIYRRLAETNPQTYLPDVAMTLNNLANLQKATNDFPAALAAYEEALTIRRRLAETTPHVYLADLAITLNDWATLQSDQNDLPAARAAYEEALAIRRRLAEATPHVYLPVLAATLNNLAVLESDENNFLAAQATYNEALSLYRRLDEANPQTYLPYVAMTLNNLANLQKATNDFPAAQAAYDEALGMYRRLAKANPQTYLPDVAMTAMNMSIFYLQTIPAREKSLEHCREALVAAIPFVEMLPAAKNYARTALKVVEAWGLDRENFWEEALQATHHE